MELLWLNTSPISGHFVKSVLLKLIESPNPDSISLISTEVKDICQSSSQPSAEPKLGVSKFTTNSILFPITLLYLVELDSSPAKPYISILFILHFSAIIPFAERVSTASVLGSSPSPNECREWLFFIIICALIWRLIPELLIVNGASAVPLLFKS